MPVKLYSELVLLRIKLLIHSLNKKENPLYYVREVLEEGIKYGGTSISDYRHADGKTGQMQLHLNVYKQKKCKVCGHSIETKVIAGRNSHFAQTVRDKGRVK